MAPFMPALHLSPAPAAAASLLCGAQTPTIVGTPGDDVINGTPGNDVIAGLGGNDVINGLGGNDFICGGDGNDTLNGGDGNDTFFGDAGDDTIDGGSGHNSLSYVLATNGVQVDLSTGRATGQGNDTLSHITDLFGGQFNDQLIGDAQANFIAGDGGSDTLAGGAGNDFLETLGLGSPRSFLIGGPGNDQLLDTTGGAFADYLDCQGLDVNLQMGTANCGGQGTDSLDSVDNVLGSQFDDTIVGNDNANIIFGEAGNDTISGVGGNDLITAGDGNDTIDGGAGTNTASFADATGPVVANIGAGVATGEGDDTLTNIQGLIGGPGNDTLVGGPGNDTIDGGLGNDMINGVAGNDTATFATSTAPVTADLAAGAAIGEGTDTLQNMENLVGSSTGHDVLRGDNNANQITAFANDTIEGRGGNDVFHGPSNASVKLSYGSAASGVNVNVDARKATGGAGNDTFDFVPNSLVGSQFADQLSCSTATPAMGCFVDGGAGNDTITGTPANDTLRGGSGDDHIVGNGGEDTVDYTSGGAVSVNLATGHATGQGTDTLTGISDVNGSPNNDTIVGPRTRRARSTATTVTITSRRLPTAASSTVVPATTRSPVRPAATSSSRERATTRVSAGAGNDFVTGDVGNDHIDGGTGTDLLDYSQASTDLQFDMNRGTLTGLGTDTATNFENFNGGFGSDFVFATEAPNVIHGGGGDDEIEGTGGNDTLFGDDGNDTITGDAGNDVIDGGNGNDNLTGGSGINTVSYARDGGGVTVDLSAGMGFATGVDTLAQFQNVTGSQFDDMLTGDAGPNVIDGLGGTDVCNGNGGTDTLLHCP